jgi:hypothetical protein
MPQLRKLLYQQTEGDDEDRWRLVFDTDAKRLFVEHKWKRGDPQGGGHSARTDELGISAFLDERGQEGAHRELVRLLTSLFEHNEGA